MEDPFVVWPGGDCMSGVILWVARVGAVIGLYGGGGGDGIGGYVRGVTAEVPSATMTITILDPPTSPTLQGHRCLLTGLYRLRQISVWDGVTHRPPQQRRHGSLKVNLHSLFHHSEAVLIIR